MTETIILIVGILLGMICGMWFGNNMAQAKKIAESTGKMHISEFNKLLRELSENIAAIPQEILDATRVRYSAELVKALRDHRHDITSMPERVIDGLREAMPKQFYGEYDNGQEPQTEEFDSPIP